MADEKTIEEQRKDFADVINKPLDTAIRKRFNPFERIAEVWDKASSARKVTYKTVKGGFHHLEFDVLKEKNAELIGSTGEETLIKLIDEDQGIQLRASEMIGNFYNVFPSKKIDVDVEGPVKVVVIDSFEIDGKKDSDSA